ncbi:N-acetylmuramoyl-L-alanine amidase [uncultured Muribaculum sp.]|uniref:N-acetylmuramoyl-L-alanine amidase n=1 Tax=uncultured Muribaculum sp. TaxID=1918613 RepID=UPI00272B8A29|nr:N-acetylmuramoyl-L-alanine amidase [uncultured Muribaculum sp.]
MGSFEIIKRSGEKIPLFSREPFCALKSATLTSALMGDDNVQLSIISSECISFEKGDKIIIGGNEYTIRTTVNRDLISEDHYQSDAIFYGVMYELMKTQYRDCDANGKSTRSTFDLTYSIKDFVKVIIYNLNRDYPGLWAFDEDNCPDTDPITIQFSKQNCLQVLQSLCSESNFKLEFKISQANGVRTIHIGKFGAKIVPPGGREFFEWGKGNGLYTLKEKKIDDKSIKTRLWIEGGTTNIRADYRNYSERLQLPFPRRLNKHKHTLADGTVIEAESEMIGILNDNDRFIEDADLREALGSDEDTAQYDNIYPRRTGEVTALVEGDINSFVDDTMDFDLTEKDANGTKYLINEVSAKINFISGLLAGQQFELAAYDHSSNTFTLKPYTDNRGLTIPTAETEAYRIRTGDKYTITEINLPKSYEDDAEEELWYAGKEDFDGMKQARAQYDLTLDRKYLIDNTPSDAETSIFNVGDYVPIKDVRFGIEKSIRIQKVVRNLLVDQDYTLTLSDTTKISVAAQTVIDVINHEQIIVNNRLRDLNKARRGWRTTEDLRNMVYDTDGFFDTDNIRPNSIDTNMLTVGSKSQQFVLTDVILQANVGGLPNRFDASAGVLSHLTINDDAIMHWNMGASEFTLGSPGGYYLFAKCSKSGNTGVWFLTQQQLRFEPEDDPNNYYFQVGILSPLREGDNFRDFVTTYGFTRINGNTITTGKIVTSDGECYLDLDGNRFRIGDAASSIDWNVTARNRITLRNVSVLSGSGDTSELGVFRGTYNPNYIYYKGDEVTYTHNGETCTYRYINPEPSMGNAPTNSVYWSIVAKGAAGEQGNSIYYTYHDGKEKPQKPTGNGTTGGWHTTSTESMIWMSIKSAKNAESGTWGEPIRVRGADGTSITIKGSTDSVSKLPMTGNTQGDAYIIGDNLYIWYGTNWQNVGQIKGEDGQTTYLHIKYSNDGGLSFTANNGEDPGSYIGQYTDFQEYDSSNPADYTWSLIRGGAGVGGADAAAGEYYEYRYAKNGSTLEPPALDKTATNPTGWSKTMPTVGTMEYVWCTMSKKSTLVDQTKFYIPVTAGSVADNSGNGYNATLYNGASIIQDGSRFAVSLNNGADARIPYDLPFGENFTLCFWIKINKTQIKWMINGYNGRDYTEQNINLQANTWIHLAFRFSGNSVTVYKNGVIQSTGTTNEMLVGWCIYDDDMFGASTLYFDDVRLLMGALPVSDIIAVMNGNVDKLIQNWSDPIRVSPYDGKDGDPGTKGDSPVLVYRGAYSSSKTYYGNSRRLDAVKYNNIYYIARIDAGEFSNIAPTNTGKWNTFGAQFETIATNLLLAEGANIGDWFMSGGKIVSTLSGSNKITLDASVAQILIESDNDGGGYSMNNFGTIIKLNASQGMLEVRAKNSPSYSTGTAYLSPNGIFANLAGTNAMPASSGYTHRGAIVGLGFANVAKRDWQLNALETIVAGVYGKASNSGTAPAFGGFFYDLYAGGLTLGKRAISGTKQTVYLNAADTMIIGYTSDTSIVYLPANPKEGQVVWVKQWWTGTMRVRPRTGHHIYDDNTENEYYDFDCGRAGMFVFTIGYITSGNTTTKKEAWLVSAWKW